MCPAAIIKNLFYRRNIKTRKGQQKKKINKNELFHVFKQHAPKTNLGSFESPFHKSLQSFNKVVVIICRHCLYKIVKTTNITKSTKAQSKWIEWAFWKTHLFPVLLRIIQSFQPSKPCSRGTQPTWKHNSSKCLLFYVGSSIIFIQIQRSHILGVSFLWPNTFSLNLSSLVMNVSCRKGWFLKTSFVTPHLSQQQSNPFIHPVLFSRFYNIPWVNIMTICP